MATMGMRVELPSGILPRGEPPSCRTWSGGHPAAKAPRETHHRAHFVVNPRRAPSPPRLAGWVELAAGRRRRRRRRKRGRQRGGGDIWSRPGSSGSGSSSSAPRSPGSPLRLPFPRPRARWTSPSGAIKARHPRASPTLVIRASAQWLSRPWPAPTRYGMTHLGWRQVREGVPGSLHGRSGTWSAS